MKVREGTGPEELRWKANVSFKLKNPSCPQLTFYKCREHGERALSLHCTRL